MLISNAYGTVDANIFNILWINMFIYFNHVQSGIVDHSLSRYYFSTCVTYHFLANLLYIKIKNNNIIKKDVQINNTLYEFIKLWLRHNRYTSFLVGSCDLIPTPDCAKSQCKSIKVICNESISNFRVQNTGMMPCQNNINVVQSKKNNLQSAMFWSDVIFL